MDAKLQFYNYKRINHKLMTPYQIATAMKAQKAREAKHKPARITLQAPKTLFKASILNQDLTY